MLRVTNQIGYFGKIETHLMICKKGNLRKFQIKYSTGKNEMIQKLS